MLKISVLVFLTLAILASSKDPTHVKSLDASTFEQFTKTNPKVLVYFYDEILPDHKTTLVEFGKAAQVLFQQNVTGIVLAKINAGKNLQLMKKLGFEDFPIIVLFDEGEQVDYDQQHEAENIVDWVGLFLREPFAKISTAQELEEILQDQQLAKVVFYGNPTGKEFKTFARLAHLDRDNPYFLIDSKDLIGSLPTPTLRVHAYFHHPDAWTSYSGDWSRQSLQNWIQDNSLPVIVPVNERTLKYVFDDKSITLFLIYLEDGENVLNVLENHCKSNKRFTCAIVTKRDGAFASMTSFLGSPDQVNKSELLLLNTKIKRFYRYKGEVAEITEELFNQWIDNWKNKKLRPDNVDASPPEDESPDAVKDDEGKCSANTDQKQQADL